MNFSNAIPADTRSAKSQAYRDLLGITASVACAIHCAAMPFVIGFLPLLGLSFLADPAFHKWMVGVCLLFALLAFVPGWKKHRQMRPAMIGMAGLFLISLAAFAGPEDCCPTPCEDSGGAPSQMAATPVLETQEEPCAASCCSPDAQSSKVTAGLASMIQGPETASCTNTCCASEVAPIVAVVKDECVSQCCAADAQTPTAGAGLVADSTPDSSTECAMSCCPPEAGVEEPMTAGMVRWMWILMTPLGGLVLVAAHLVNHRSSCQCAAGCCDGHASPSKD